MKTVNRRHFLGSTVSLLGGPAVLSSGIAASTRETAARIDRIELFPLRYPTTGYFKFFIGPRGFLGRAAVIVKITADNGVTGWGQSVPIAQTGRPANSDGRRGCFPC